ncbi:MAG: DegT/DnrJ/EryC1/StrS family aminotransferase [Terriglobia bacterium]
MAEPRRRIIQTIPIARVELDEREIRAVEKVLRSGRLRAGRVVEEFEKRFARWVGVPYAVAVNSGTAALHLAYQALLAPGDEIIVPDFTFVATASMALAVGARPVFADVDPATCTLDPADAARRITRRTRALAPVHLYGNPAAIGRLTRLARKHRLRIIWDAAQAHGAQYRGRDVGSFPDVVCYSFYPSKNLTTAEGGMLTTSDAKLAATLLLARSHGEESRYLHTRLGFNFRLTDVAAALGCEQLRKLPAAIRRRRHNAATLTRGLRGIPGLELPQAAPDTQHAFNLYTVRVQADRLGISRDEFRKALAERGVETAVHYPRALHQQPLFAGFGDDDDFPSSAELARTVLSLPVHPALSEQDLRKMIRSVKEVVGCGA